MSDSTSEQAEQPYPKDDYSIEVHGDAYVLYYGRSEEAHGYNLCKLSNFDCSGEETRAKIVVALNTMLKSHNSDYVAALQEMDKAIKCLVIQVPYEVHKDISERWQHLKDAMENQK